MFSRDGRTGTTNENTRDDHTPYRRCRHDVFSLCYLVFRADGQPSDTRGRVCLYPHNVVARCEGIRRDRRRFRIIIIIILGRIFRTSRRDY